ncbi:MULTISPECIES: hypothetical protein [Rhizobium]|uniref:hypothetical protein n=1 Tax=Rhizobium TaxID=379 RepID=UPI00103CC8A6|nr:hypothetical protein [Rhizobium leguminosarum]TBZ35919.1 hypothetical protein E0H44_30630 [Rhizobium leguminosarum bv. viciae]TCA01187.1 hypothetical protein E0H68_37190 [Rhizobium leguminosarum bv. viciae]TCA14917.1 hypothetical protein E0H67_35610 [Rhizobium leguminosarum bv. viciae]
MATLDPRLFELFETLRASQLDWMIFELMEGIQAGRHPKESPDNLARARHEVQSDSSPEFVVSPMSEAAPISGDEQIEWAVQYVADRLDATLAELGKAADNLDTIVNGNAAKTTIIPKQGQQEVTIELADGDGARKLGRNDIVAASVELPGLRKELEAWSAQVRGQV